MSFQDDAGIAISALQHFARSSAWREGPVVTQEPLADLLTKLDADRLIAEGGLHGETLNRFLKAYLAHATRLHDPRYMAHQVAVPLPHGAIAALIDSFTNNAMAIYEMGPAAASIEFAIVNWMLAKAGFAPAPLPGADAVDQLQPDEAASGGGVLTHGGSLANLTALLAARARVAPDAWSKGSPPGLVLVVPPSSHYSVSRAAGVMGLGQSAICHAPTDPEGRIDAERLPSFLDRLLDDGAKPIAVVANACSTALGLYDPIRAVAEVCGARGIWLHVDGAHGASALVCPQLRHLLDGVELADSLVWDAHKMLRAPTLCAAVLVRDHRSLDQAFREEASYLFHDKEQPGFDFIHRTLECTKAALGLKIFFALACDGESAIARYIERQTELARQAADMLRAMPGLQVAVEPQSNIVCFRLEGSDALQLDLRRALMTSAEFYISTAEALGKRWLRLALMNPATALTDIEALVQRLFALSAGRDASGGAGPR